jgi:hypothetical protein
MKKLALWWKVLLAFTLILLITACSETTSSIDDSTEEEETVEESIESYLVIYTDETISDSSSSINVSSYNTVAAGGYSFEETTTDDGHDNVLSYTATCDGSGAYIEFDTTDISEYQTLHIDCYSTDMQKIDIFVYDSDGSYQGEHWLNFSDLGEDSWISNDISLSSDDIEAAKIRLNFYINSDATTGTIYLDNIYFSSNEDTTEDTSDEEDSTSESDGAITTDEGYNLVAVADDMEMTFQFVNSTDGQYADDEIYLIILARDSNSDWCKLEPDGTMTVLGLDETSDSWYYLLSDIDGTFQVPQTATSGRAYFSYGEPVIMSTTEDGNGDVGLVQPTGSGDGNDDIYYEWFEFTVSGGGYWGNTTQVDQYCFSYTKSLYENGDGLELVGKVGIEEGRDDIFSEFEAIDPSEFQVLVEDYRIVAPCKADGGFSSDDTYGTYMDDYVDDVWDFLTTQHVVIDHDGGRYVTEINTDSDDETLTFYKYSTTETDFLEENREDGPFEITGQPTSNELFEGSGVLATGDTDELCIEAWICACLNRHCGTCYQDETIGGYIVADWNNTDNYYPTAYDENPANHYARFWHDHSIDNKAYGFCYDDVNDQSTLLQTQNDPRAVVIEMLWN